MCVALPLIIPEDKHRAYINSCPPPTPPPHKKPHMRVQCALGRSPEEKVKSYRRPLILYTKYQGSR